MAIVALDLGGTRLKAGLVRGETPTVSAFTTVPVAGVDGHAALDAVLATCREVLARGPHGSAGDPVTGIALAVPGLVANGRLEYLPGKFPGLTGIDLRRELQSAFGVPAGVLNDALAYGAGEVTRGAGREASRVIVMTIGTGVGTSVFEHGRPLGAGPRGGGTSCGQIPITDPRGGVDTAGRRGTIEARCRASMIVDLAVAAGGTFADVVDVYAAHATGDPAAREGIEEYRHHLARAIVALTAAYTPEVVVLGGGPMVAGNPIFPGLQQLVDRELWSPCRAPIRLGRLGDHASLVGGAALLRASVLTPQLGVTIATTEPDGQHKREEPHTVD